LEIFPKTNPGGKGLMFYNRELDSVIERIAKIPIAQKREIETLLFLKMQIITDSIVNQKLELDLYRMAQIKLATYKEILSYIQGKTDRMDGFA
jgi:hypothetical protein